MVPPTSHLKNGGVAQNQNRISQTPPPIPPPRSSNQPPQTPPSRNILAQAQMSQPLTPQFKRVSPVTVFHHQSEMVPGNSVGHQQNLQNVFSPEPPPPQPPPSYFQTLSMRQSPTLSTTSSDYPYVEFQRYPNVEFTNNSFRKQLLIQKQLQNGSNGLTGGTIQGRILGSQASTIAPSPTPSASSMSSMTSSTIQAYAARQAMNSSPGTGMTASSMRVQQPVLQKATALTNPQVPKSMNVRGVIQPEMAQPLTRQQRQPSPSLINRGCRDPSPATDTSSTSTITAMPDPPSYEVSVQQKQQLSARNSPAAVMNGTGSQSPIPVPVPVNPNPGYQRGSPQPRPPPPSYNKSPLMVPERPTPGNKSQPPPPPPYPSSHVNNKPPSLPNDMATPSPSSNTERPPPPPYSSSVATLSRGFHSQNDDSSESSSSGATSMGPPLPPPRIQTSPLPQRKNSREELPEEEEQIKKPGRYVRPRVHKSVYKFFMAQQYEKVINYPMLRERRKQKVINELDRHFGNRDMNPDGWDKYMKAFYTSESSHLRTRRILRHQAKRKDFTKKKMIGKGFYGKVSLVTHKNLSSKQYTFAMKSIKKEHLVKYNKVAQVIAEKDILAEATNDWIVKLHYSFQDKKKLYFVMEFIPGGDLMAKLMKDGKFSEELACFYTAELVCAVESVHAMGFIHRDIKPDNILIDGEGHIKLTDFGLCTGFRWTHNSEQYVKEEGEKIGLSKKIHNRSITCLF